MASRQPKGKGKGRSALNFDLSKPIKYGRLLKQGALHKAFKHRFFVLYPGFLVYYEEQTKWKLDVTRGDTLQSRQGAIKLRNGSCNVAKQSPKGCKFGFIVYAPDPSNKRPSYLINATSKEERDLWIQAIREGTPQSPSAGRKPGPKKSDSTTSESEESKPKFVQKQQTVDAAARIATESLTENIDEKVTNIDNEITGTESSMSIRRDTSSTAALLATKLADNSDDVFDADELAVSIDLALGKSTERHDTTDDMLECSKEQQDEDTTVAEATQVEQSPVENGDTVNEKPVESTTEGPVENGEVPENTIQNLSQEMETESNISELKTSSGTEIVTQVVVVLNSDGEVVSSSENVAVGDNERTENSQTAAWDSNETKPQETATDGLLSNTEAEASAVSEQAQSTEIVIPAVDERHNNSFTINASNSDSDSESDSEDSSPPPPEVQSPGSKESTPEIVVESTCTAEENVANGETTPNGDVPSLSPLPEKFNAARRPSAAFIQKTGYLYKMGGNRKNWKLRYFVLNPGMFAYYKSPKTLNKPLGEVKLKNSKVYFPGAGERKITYQFCIHTESKWNKRPEWPLAAQSEKEMKDWIEAFKAAAGSPIPTPTGSPTGSPRGSPTGSEIEN